MPKTQKQKRKEKKKSVQERFYNRETIPFIMISTLTESPSNLSWLAKILELRKGLIIWAVLKEEGGNCLSFKCTIQL